MNMPSTSGRRPEIARRSSSSNQQGFFSSSLLSVGSSLKTVGNTAGRGLRHAVSAGYDHLTSDTSDKEDVLYVKFSHLEFRSTAGLQQQPVLLLGYETGFQVWDLKDCAQIQELVSRRDGAVGYASRMHLLLSLARNGLDINLHLCCSLLEVVPWPHKQPDPSSALRNAWPVLAVAPAAGCDPATSSSSTPTSDHCVQLYSMQSHTYVHSLSFNSKVLSLRCSPRLIVVALNAQIHAFDATTLQHTFSAVTYSVSAALQNVKGDSYQAGVTAPMALGSAWLAYASNQASKLAICRAKLG